MKIDDKKLITTVIVCILFFILPFISIPILLIEIYNGRKYALYLLAIFMGVLSMFYFPNGDQYRYMQDLLLYRGASFEDVFDFDTILIFRNLNLVNIFIYLCSKIPFITIELVRFVFVLIGFLLVFSIYKSIEINMEEAGVSRKRRFLMFMVLFLSCPLYYITQGFRSGLGSCFLIFGLYKFIKGEKGVGIVNFILACLIHYSYVVYIIIIIFGLNNRHRYKWSDIIWMAVFVLAVVGIAITALYSRVPIIQLIIDTYIYGKWGTDIVLNGYLIKEILLINGLPVVVMYMVSLSIKDKSRLKNILIINLVLLLISLPFHAIEQRLGIVSLQLLALYIAISYDKKIIFSKIGFLLLFLGISFIYPFWMHRLYYQHSDIEKITYMPLPELLQNTYEERSVYKVLNSDGIIKK